MSRGDRVAGIVLGLVLGIALVAIFVFVFSEDTIDSAQVQDSNGQATSEQPAPER